MTISSSRLGVLTTVALHGAVLAGLLAYSRRDDVAAAATSPSDVAAAPDENPENATAASGLRR